MNSEYQQLDTLLKQREIKKAEVLIARLLRSDALPKEDEQRLLIYRARTRLLSARPTDALDDLLLLKEQHPELFDNPAVLELLADSYFARFELASVGFAERQDAAIAAQIYRDILAQFPEYANTGWVQYQLGRILLSLDEFEEAEKLIREAMMSPSDIASLTAYCYERLAFIAYYEQRDAKRAETLLRKAIDTYPTSEPVLWLAQVYLFLSKVRHNTDKEAALEAVRQALAIAQRAKTDNRAVLSEIYLTTAELLHESHGSPEDIIQYVNQFMQVSKKPLGVDVTWSRAYEMLADAYMALQRYDDAVDAYLMVLELNPYHPWETSIYYRIACSYYQTQEYKRALRAVDHIFEHARQEGQEVSDYHVYEVLGNALFALGNYQQASEAYEQALSLAPASASIEKIRAYLKYAQEKLNEPSL